MDTLIVIFNLRYKQGQKKVVHKNVSQSFNSFWESFGIDLSLNKNYILKKVIFKYKSDIMWIFITIKVKLDILEK